MKLLIALCLVALVGLSLAIPKPPKRTHNRGCVFVQGVCVRECDEGSLAYLTGCENRKPPPTCDNPNPEPDPTIKVCDFNAVTACYCNPPTVRNTIIDKCVPLDECPKKV